MFNKFAILISLALGCAVGSVQAAGAETATASADSQPEACNRAKESARNKVGFRAEVTYSSCNCQKKESAYSKEWVCEVEAKEVKK